MSQGLVFSITLLLLPPQISSFYLEYLLLSIFKYIKSTFVFAGKKTKKGDDKEYLIFLSLMAELKI